MAEREYRVRWETDVVAANEVAAAKLALEMQRDPNSIATGFVVRERRGEHLRREGVEVDLQTK